MSSSNNESVVIKKYANRRLYNTATSTYVTLEDLSAMVKEGTEFNVYDAKSNEDITRAVLTQIIVEEEGKTGQNLLPIGFLRNLIGFYGDSLQWLVPKYLEHSLQSLSKNQTQIRDYFQTTLGGLFPFGSTLEQMGKQNMAMFERTMRMFSPFGIKTSTGQDASAENGCCTTQMGNDTPQTTAECCNTKNKAAEEEATTTVNLRTVKKTPHVTAVPTPETTKAAAQNAVSGEEVQNKIAALQRQLSELAKKA